MLKSRKFLAVLAVVATIAALFFVLRPARSDKAAPVQQAQLAQQTPPVALSPRTPPPSLLRPTPKVQAPVATPEDVRSELPKVGTRAKRRVWVHSKYGADEHQLGKFVAIGEGEDKPPQGFVPTRDGKLLVLDSAKMRLVWFGADGKFERSMPLAEGSVLEPADVAIAGDGTIVVVDHIGLQTKGALLLDPSGKKKGELPQLQGTMSNMYTVGNDVYATSEGASSIKLGDTSGSASDETPGIYRNEENGRVPGVVAPDGHTVVGFGGNDDNAASFYITAMKGDPPEHLFTRFYKYPYQGQEPDGGVLFAQSDAQGRIYVVLYYDRGLALMCVDGKTGDAVGLVSMPLPPGGGGTQFRMFSVPESGGLIYQEAGADSATYEWFNCH